MKWWPKPVEPIDWQKKCAQAEVERAIALGFLKTIPGEDADPEKAEAWRGRLNRFLAQIDGEVEP